MDAYEKGEGEYSLLTADLVEARVNTDGKVTTAITDQGEQLTFTQPMAPRWVTTADTTYRALLYYKVLGSGQAEAVSMSSVGVLLPLDSVQGGMKTDPLHLESAWVGHNHRYLNLRLRLLTGSTDDADARHTIGLLRDSVASTPAHARLTLYHDQGGRPEYYSAVTYASIPLDSIPADSLTLTVTTYDGQVSRSFQLR